MENRIWVLGSDHRNVEKSILWDSDFPNFANCDTLIINLDSLTIEMLNARQLDLINQARRYLFDLLMAGEHKTFVILSPIQSMSNWLPIIPQLKETAPVEIDEYPPEGPINEYMKVVENCPFYIDRYLIRYFVERTDPGNPSHENYFFTNEAARGYYRCVIENFDSILNKAKQTVGSTVGIDIHYGRHSSDY